MKIYLSILVFLSLTFSAIASSTLSIPADTTRIYGVPLWRFDRLLNDALGRRAADSSYRAAVKALVMEHLRVYYLDSAFTHQTNEVAALTEAKAAIGAALTDCDRRAVLWEKESRRQKRQKGATVVGGLALIVLSYLLGHAH